MADSEADTLELPPVPNFGHGRPRWAAQRIHPRRLATGNRALTRRLRAWVAAEGQERREMKVAGRAGALGLVGLLAWRTGHQQPALLAAAAGSYAIAAWRAGRPVPPTADELRRRFLESLLPVIGDDRPGIHLGELYAALQSRPPAAHLDDTRLRSLLVHCHIPIHKSLRIGEITGRSGIKAADIQALLSPKTPPGPSDGVDAGHDVAEGAVDRP
ncbi:hypothetical protein AB0M94_06625 [Streptomyces xanthochromogenes]|uniref:hypothetical protein n=1 Tax=Streptomyces xanthochromogenes TaxID=67384 RepID=UPI0034271491